MRHVYREKENPPMMTSSKPWSALNAVALSGPQKEDSSPWLVVHDPEGDFSNRRFREIDLQRDDNWPEGTIFWHGCTGALRIWKGGKFIPMFPKPKKDAPAKAGNS
jgi:hypothetical protein